MAETTGAEISREAIRLGRLLLDLFQEPEVVGPAADLNEMMKAREQRGRQITAR